MRLRTLFLSLCLACASCTSTPPGPAGADSAGLGIRVRVRAPVRMFSQNPEQVLFVRLAGPGGGFTGGEPMPSNYQADGYLYLLNAPPGTYVAVSCFKKMEPVPAAGTQTSSGFSVIFQPGATNYTTYFPEDMVRATQVTVRAGEVAFVGEFVVDQDLGLDEGDATQRYYYALFGQGEQSESFLENALGGDYHYRGSLHSSSQDAVARSHFVKAGGGRLAEAGWKPREEP